MADIPELSLFIGDLAPDVTEGYLESFFRQYFSSVRGAKVVTDPATGRSKGYGFVRFTNESDRERALHEMNGVYISTRPIRVSIATAKRQGDGLPPRSTPSTSAGGASSTAATVSSAPHPDADPNNTTLFIGGLSQGVSEEQLRFVFARYGDIVYTKIPQGKGCGFVQFVDRKAAEYAMQEMQGYLLGGQAIRISWGRSSAKAPISRDGPGPAPHAAYGYPYPYPYDPHGYGAYGMYPPDAYYGYHGMDPYSSMYYGMPGYPSATTATGHAAIAAATGQPAVYDPLAPVPVERMNAMYMHRHLPIMTGSFMRIPHHMGR